MREERCQTEMFRGIDVKENCSTATMISCEHIESHAVLITIKQITNTELPLARIRGVVITSNSKHIASDEQIFPEIKDSTDVNSKLFIDGAEITRISNSYVANAVGPDINLRFECESKVLPCLIEISEVGLMKPVQAKGYVTHLFGQQQLNITIKQALCTLSHYVDTLLCNVKTNSTSRTDQISNPYWHFAYLGLIPFFFCSSYLLAFRKRSHCQGCWFVKKKGSMKRSNNKKKTHDDKDYDPKNTGELKGMKSTDERSEYESLTTGTKDQIKQLLDFFKALECDDVIKIRKLHFTPNSSGALLSPHRPAIFSLRSKNGISYEVKRITVNDINHTCACPDLKFHSSENVKIVVSMHELDEDKSRNISKLEVGNILNSNNKMSLKINKTENMDVEHVTCDTILIEKLDEILNKVDTLNEVEINKSLKTVNDRSVSSSVTI